MVQIRFGMAGVAGFEPTMNGSEPFALPLGDTPLLIKIISRFVLASHKIFGWQILIMALVGDAV